MEVRGSKSVSLLRCWSWIVVAMQDERKLVGQKGGLRDGKNDFWHAGARID